MAESITPVADALTAVTILGEAADEVGQVGLRTGEHLCPHGAVRDRGEGSTGDTRVADRVPVAVGVHPPHPAPGPVADRVQVGIDDPSAQLRLQPGEAGGAQTLAEPAGDRREAPAAHRGAEVHLNHAAVKVFEVRVVRGQGPRLLVEDGIDLPLDGGEVAAAAVERLGPGEGGEPIAAAVVDGLVGGADAGAGVGEVEVVSDRGGRRVHEAIRLRD